MQMDTQGGRAAEPVAPAAQPLIGSRGWLRASSLSSAASARPDPVAEATHKYQPWPLRSRPPSKHRGGSRWGGPDRKRLNRLPQAPASTATMGLSRIIVKPVRHRSPGRRPLPASRDKDSSVLSVLLAVVLGLLLLAVGLYGIFLGMSQREYETVPALAPVGQRTDPDLTAPSPAWKEHLRALLSSGFGQAGRELLTSALGTALPGFVHTGVEQVAGVDSTQTRQTAGGRSVWGWLAAFTGIDVRSPSSILTHTLPGLIGLIPDDQFGRVRTVDLPSRGGSGAMSSAWGESTIGAGAEWPLPEALPDPFVDAPASASPLTRTTHDPSGSSSVIGSAGTSDTAVDAGSSQIARTTDAVQSGSGHSSEPAGASGSSSANSDPPLVLVYHTHTAESYHEKGRESEKDHYDWNSTDSGVIRVGKEITAALRAAGIPAIHSVEVNDYPQFSRSYSSSRQLVRDYLKRYPSIVVAFDVHRDGTAYEPDTVSIAGKQTARIAFIVGSNTSVLPNPHWRQNLVFAQQLHKALQEVHSGLSRGIMLREDARFNQDLLPKLLVVEIGTYTNELAEAREAGRILGRVVADILKRN